LNGFTGEQLLRDVTAPSGSMGRAEPARVAVARPPAYSRLLRLYGRYVPTIVRAAVRERMPTAVRSHLARRLTSAGAVARVADRVAASRVRALNKGPGGGDRVLVRLPSGTFVATLSRDANATAVRDATLRFVQDALAAAGIDAFRVRPYHAVTTAVGISSADWDRAQLALRTACVDRPFYVSRIARGRVAAPHPGEEASTWQRVSGDRIIRINQFVTDPTGQLVFGPKYGCDLEIWAVDGDRLTAPRPNRVTDEVPASGPAVLLPESSFSRHPMPAWIPPSRTRPQFAGTLLDDVAFPIDAVYTWVDGADPAWRDRRDRALAAVDGRVNEQAVNDSRFANRDELRYSLRSLHQYAPWINHIWLVTDDQVPSWLDPAHPMITVVSHKEIFRDPGVLPTFNSHAIESQLHRIDGLTEHFLYFNDDVMLGRPVLPHQFFHPNGLTKLFPSTAKIDTAAPHIDDVPVTAAGKNNRAVVAAAFGRTVTYKMKHCPHALRRSALSDMEHRLPAVFEATASHRFRHVDDVSVPSALYHYVQHAGAQATIGEVRYMYTDLADPKTPSRLRIALAGRGYDVMCLNDTATLPDEAQQRLLAEFLRDYYPVPAPWELPANLPVCHP